MISSDILSVGNPFWLGMANHLWQSTLFAVAALLFTMFLNKNRARIRYWIWFSVSIKFLIPFTLIVSLGGLIAPEGMKAPAEITPKLNVFQTINQPFKPSELKEISPAVDVDAPSPSNKVPWIILPFWLCGSLAVLLIWYKQRMRVSAMVRNAEVLKDGHTVNGFHRIKLEIGVSQPVQLASTRDAMEPGVFGVFRPVILLPTGILSHINDSELETILLHEFAHIQYRDNLIAFIHMLVEALFWFHPIVWWTGSRLVSERERACDESVLQSGKNPRAYAEGILKICEHYFMSPPACVSGVIGSNLKNRVEGIMKKQVGHKLSLAKKLILSLAGISVLCIPLSIGMITAPQSQAHPSGDTLMESVAVANKPDIYMASGKPEGNNEPPEAINSDEVSTLEEKLSDNPVMRKNSPAIVMAHSEIQTSTNTVEKTRSVEAVRKPLLSSDAEDSVLLSQKETPVIVSSDEVNSDIEPEPEDADADRNQDLPDLEKPGTIPEKYNLDNELEAVDQISTFRIESIENIDKQSLILEADTNDYYLLVLRRPRFENLFGGTGISYLGHTIIAGHDRVVMNTRAQYYFIDKIYRFKDRKQVTEIKARLLKK